MLADVGPGPYLGLICLALERSESVEE
jgi:hypothetical protein